MTGDETELEMVRRHVAEGSEHVSRQHRILAELRRDGHPTAMAEQLLQEMERTQQLNLAHLGRLQGGARG